VASSSRLDLDVRGRTLFAALYLAAQAGLVLTSALRPDGVFSFQMFNESSTIKIELGRRISTKEGERTVPLDGRRSGWSDRIQDPILGTLGREVHASYGVDAQLFRLQRALDDVASRMAKDGETVALVADVQIRRNGRPPVVRHLESARRSE
jgi:hypothetical protein